MKKDIFVKFVNYEDIPLALERVGFDRSYLHHAVKKNQFKTIEVYNIRPQEASILKQSALALGFDAAVHRGVLDCSVESSNAILTGSIVQFEKLAQALQRQPFKMKQIANNILDLLKNGNFAPLNYGKINFDWKRPYLMGILNITPDSFSDGGKFESIDKAIAQFVQLVQDGADIVDIGAESTRPGHIRITSEEEILRLGPILDELKRLNSQTPISVDTRNVATAKFVMDYDVDIINDVGDSGFNYKMIDFVNSVGVPYVVTHNKSIESSVDEVYSDLLEILEQIKSPVVADFGLGFGKTLEQNFDLIKKIDEFKGLGVPLMVGHSRKSFISKTLDLPSECLDEATAFVSAKLFLANVNIVRVHDIARHKRLLDIIRYVS